MRQQASYLVRKLGDLHHEGLLATVIERNVRGVIRKFKNGQLTLWPPPNVGNIVPKKHFLYVLVLRSGQIVLCCLIIMGDGFTH